MDELVFVKTFLSILFVCGVSLAAFGLGAILVWSTQGLWRALKDMLDG